MSLKSKLNETAKATRDAALISVAILVPYTAATVAVNCALAGTYAAQEGVERIFGAETREYQGTLKSSRELLLPNGHGKLIEGTFTLSNGIEVKIIDAPVVTEGKYWPGMKDLQEGQKYTVTAFDGMGNPRFVKADKH